MEYSYPDVKDFIDKNYKSFTDFNNDCISFMNEKYDDFSNFNDECIKYISCVDKDNFEKYLSIIKEKGSRLGRFNLFELLNDKYYCENFHSYVLKFMLKEVPSFFENFLKLIGADVDNFKNYEVHNEKDRIDVSIESDSHAIIIENKIYGAGDQDAQIYRYYKKVVENNQKIVEKIVYLTPSKYNPSDNSIGLDIDENEDKNKKDYIKDIKSKLINIVGFNGKNDDLVSCLKDTLESLQEESNEDYRVFVKHYIDILKDTGVGDMSVIASNFLEGIREQVKEDKDIVSKLSYMKEMFDNLTDVRLNFMMSKGEVWDWEDRKFISKGYKTKKDIEKSLSFAS